MPPVADLTLRTTLLDYFIENQTGPELTEWLRDIGQDSKGSVAEKKARIRASTKYLTMPAEAFPEQTMSYLDLFPSGHLADICSALGLPDDGTKDSCYRRIMREVRYREGWSARPDRTADSICTTESVRTHVEWYPIKRRGQYESDFYPAFAEEMDEVFGQDNVHEQLAIAYGNTLKIDFHIGPPQGDGVGVEFKMPTTNSELQRALGQLDQYKSRYGDRLLMVLLPDFLDRAQQALFTDCARGKESIAATLRRWKKSTSLAMAGSTS